MGWARALPEANTDGVKGPTRRQAAVLGTSWCVCVGCVHVRSYLVASSSLVMIYQHVGITDYLRQRGTPRTRLPPPRTPLRGQSARLLCLRSTGGWRECVWVFVCVWVCACVCVFRDVAARN